MTTVALIDGLGHGPEAALAAKRAIAIVRENVRLPIDQVLSACHLGLRGTRGAALTLVRCSANARQLSHCGVGNVELTGITREAIRPIAIPGIVGVRARKIVATSYALHTGDLILLHTDGISSRLSLERMRGLEPQAIANAVLEQYAKVHDDAACIVIRC